ncbi:hypothetical protein ACFYV5_03335 [Streptomyces sp. NPDC003035]|uniref:hypothetical protein n=1 Tax=Streptomyces sp. NPDC003035 TaxID=3364676 RepID=UPI0036AEF879
MSYPHAVQQHVADCWFVQPPGFFAIDVHDVGAARERMDAVLDTILPPADRTDETVRTTQGFFDLLEDLVTRDAVHLAIGLHPDERKGMSTSVLAVSDIGTGAPSPAAAGALCSLAMVSGTFGMPRDRAIVHLECGRPAALATALLPAPPPHLMEGRPFAPLGVSAFQARLVIARERGSRALLFELTTTSLASAEDYVDVLLGIGQTVRFTDPHPTEAEVPLRPSRLLEVLL